MLERSLGISELSSREHYLTTREERYITNRTQLLTIYVYRRLNLDGHDAYTPETNEAVREHGVHRPTHLESQSRLKCLVGVDRFVNLPTVLIMLNVCPSPESRCQLDPGAIPKHSPRSARCCPAWGSNSLCPISSLELPVDPATCKPWIDVDGLPRFNFVSEHQCSIV